MSEKEIEKLRNAEIANPELVRPHFTRIGILVKKYPKAFTTNKQTPLQQFELLMMPMAFKSSIIGISAINEGVDLLDYIKEGDAVKVTFKTHLNTKEGYFIVNNQMVNISKL
jgi:uncharacterized membrane protein